MRLWAGLLLIVAATPACAADARVDWPTFYRSGPSREYKVVEELLRGTILDVRSCNDQWCAVQLGRTLGYVERSALDSNAFPPGPQVGGTCFESRRAGYGKGEMLLYCRR